MKLILALGTIAAFTASAVAQAPDADVSIVQQQINNVVAAVQSLDQQVTAYTGPSNTASLEQANQAVLQALSDATSAINTLPNSEITINQAASSLLPSVQTLNTQVQQATQDVQNQKTLFVSSCIGPTILQALQNQLTGATAFRDAIVSKLDDQTKPYGTSSAQASIDALNTAISDYSDQTSLPASCTATSSSAAVSSSSAAVASSSAPVVVSSSPAAVISTSAAVTAASSSSGVLTSPASRSRTTTTTTVCPGSNKTPKTTTTTTVCRGQTPCGCPNGNCPKPTSSGSGGNGGMAGSGGAGHCPGGCGTTTGSAKYTGAANHIVAGAEALAVVGAAMVFAF